MDIVEGQTVKVLEQKYLILMNIYIQLNLEQPFELQGSAYNRIFFGIVNTTVGCSTNG